MTLAACGGVSDEHQASLSEPLLTERRGGIAERVYFQYASSSEVTLRSYAAISGHGCSGTMIGPNTMLSAGHCGPDQMARFRVYPREGEQRTETYECNYLFQLWPEVDWALHWCFPKDGINPGDRFGYVDFDIDVSPQGHFDYGSSRERLQVGVGLYSVWANGIRAVDDKTHHIYSRGAITRNDGQSWFNPGGDPCRDDDDDPLAIDSDVWGRSGASGSSQLSLATNRMLVGPLSSATNSEDGAAFRAASSVADILYWGKIWDSDSDPSAPNCGGRAELQINTVALQTLWDQGIRIPGTSVADYVRYVRWIDDDLDGMIDLQHDLEQSAGVARRDHYMLGFQSNRKNALWSRGPDATIYVGSSTVSSGYANKRGTSDEWQMLLGHSRLNLDPSAVYRLSYRASSPNGGWATACMNPASCFQHFVEPGRGQVFVERFTAAQYLQFHVWADADITVSNVSLVKEGATLTFDTDDERSLWFRHTPSRHPRPTPILDAGLVWPNGKESGSRIDFAGIVRRPSFSGDWFNLSSSMLAIPKGEVQICFDYARPPNSAGNGDGVVRLRSVPSSELRFAPTASWQRICTAWVTTATDDNTLDFGSNGDTDYTYAVDNIDISRR